MASGFIILRDGRCFAVRHALHDAVLRSIATALDDGSPLRTWLVRQVPDSLDYDLGYAFVRIVDGEHVSRHLDLRGLTEANRKLFESAARRAAPIAGPYSPTEDVISALAHFREMLDRCDRGEPPLELSDWTCQAPPVEGNVGPGWEDSD